MIAEMTSYYGELQDHDGPPSRAVMNTRTSIDRKSRTSELSLDLDDLEDMRVQRTSSHRNGSGDNNTNSGFSLSSWVHEPEATTGNLMMRGSSLGGFLHPSLDSVIEDSVEEFASFTMLRTDGICETIQTRPRHYSSDDTPIVQQEQQRRNEDSSSTCFGRSKSWDGTLSGSLSEMNLERLGKKVHFEVPSRLENIHEFEKPEYEDYNKLYYMTHEIQKMMDDFRAESELDRHVVR